MTDQEDSFELTRRDVITALGAAGITVGGAALVLSEAEFDDDAMMGTPGGTDTPENEQVGDHELATVAAVAEVVYPSAVENAGEFATQYVSARVAADPDHSAGIADSVAYLDDYTDSWTDQHTFESLSVANRRSVLTRMRAERVAPNPGGGSVQRVRYYLINELLYALYSSPTGGTLVGLENPEGYPGGTTSYQRGPRD
ncbi:MAG: gluconate 2-dehydrogenase subunit 3 family protein [Halorientalis sp.]